MNQSESFYHLFHPIIGSYSNKPIGYEALLRSTNETDPLMLFSHARKKGILVDLDLHSINLALSNTSCRRTKIFINIFPTTLLSQKFIELIEDFDNKDNIILEINESNDDYHTWNDPSFNERLSLLNQLNIKWALDDVGTGQASIQRVLELCPKYIKLDRYFSAALANTRQKQRVLSFFVNYCKEEQIELILEGVETEEDLIVAKDLGVPHFQGYYFGRPKRLSELKGDNNG